MFGAATIMVRIGVDQSRGRQGAVRCAVVVYNSRSRVCCFLAGARVALPYGRGSVAQRRVYDKKVAEWPTYDAKGKPARSKRHKPR